MRRTPAVDPALAHRVIVERIQPEIDGGRFPIKRTVHEVVDVAADIFADGHDVIVARLDSRPTSADAWVESAMSEAAAGSDEWRGQFEVTSIGWWEYRIIAWVDRFLTWRRDVRIKATAGQDVALELLEGSLIVRDAADRASGTSAHDALLNHADALSEHTPIADRVTAALGEPLAALMLEYADRSRATVSPLLRVWVDRERARFGAWYEMFPRSAGPDPTRSATFAEAALSLARIADLGFDVVYLPPIHPIGTSFRKGRNNALKAQAGDPGSP